MICNIELNQVTFLRGLTPTNDDVGVSVEHFSKKKYFENKNFEQPHSAKGNENNS